MPKQGQQKATPARRAEFIAYLRTVGPGDACIAWPWSDTSDTYARIRIDGEKTNAHRWVYEQIYGVSLPKALTRGPGEVVVRHACDNRGCVRPSHLLSGSPLDNTRDAVERGRLRGNPHPLRRVGMDSTGKGKLSNADAAEIRRLVAEGASQTAMAARYGVSNATVSHVVHGKTHTGGVHGNRRISDRQATEMRRLVLQGAKQADVARTYGVAEGTVSKIINNKPR